MTTPVVIVPPQPSHPAVLVTPTSVQPAVFVAPPGPPGPPGGAPAPIKFTLVLVSTWTQEHAFGYPPSVRLVDAGGHHVVCTINYPDSTHVSIFFPRPFTGTAVLS